MAFCLSMSLSPEWLNEDNVEHSETRVNAYYCFPAFNKREAYLGISSSLTHVKDYQVTYCPLLLCNQALVSAFETGRHILMILNCKEKRSLSFQEVSLFLGANT